VEIVDVATGAGRATGPAGFDRPLALTNDGQLLVVGTPRNPDDGQSIVAAVDAATGEQLFRIGSLHDGERGAFTSDAEVALIPISPHDADPGLWAVDASTGRRIGWGPPERCITAVAVSADDTTAATVGCDGRVSLYDIATLKGPEPWTARIGGAADDRAPGVGVTFGPDDETVIVTRQDGRVEAYSADSEFARLWSFDVGDHVGIPSVRDGMVWVGATTPYVSAEAASGGVIAMPLDLDELVAFARGSLTRELTDGECQEYLDRASCAGA
jgi:WD40 repeat protein